MLDYGLFVKTAKMRMIMKRLLSWCIVFTLNPFMLSAEEAVAVDVNALSTTPVVQDAQWAVKWWMPRHEAKIQQRKEMDNKVDLLFIGDSITHAFDDKGKDVWVKYYAPRRALNLGFSGDRTEHVLWRLQNGAIDDIDPKLAIVMIGTNNTGHRDEDPENTAKGVKAILDTLNEKLPNTRILLLAIFPRGPNPENPKRKLNDEANQIIKTFADGKTIHWLNINDVFLTEDGVLEKSVMKDLLHPNADQYEKWAEAMEPKVKELMGE
jgi:beta-glucosidase